MSSFFSRHRKLRFFSLLFVALYIIVFAYHTFKPLPEGLNVRGQEHSVSEENVEFLYDLTYEQDGKRVLEQKIFNRLLAENEQGIIAKAEKFIIIDMFLFNSDYPGKDELIPLMEKLRDALIAKKRATPSIDIVFITDPINTFYGSYTNDDLEALRDAGITVVTTKLQQLRDSNPWYSSLWRIAFQWFGTRGDGMVPHPLGRTDTDVTLRSYFSLMNTKANHRKVAIADEGNTIISLITSANPHNASGYHSNIAFVVKDAAFGRELVESELAIARFSGVTVPELRLPPASATASEAQSLATVQVLTEQAIKKELLAHIENLASGDGVDMAMFYLSDRYIVKAILAAAERGVSVRIILDSNRDAFSREKNGIPNRQVAHELVEKSNGKIRVRWYHTHGEQFHAKMTILKKNNRVIAFGGSANYTRRNLNNLNLETIVKVEVPVDSTLAGRITKYFDEMWNNNKAMYTLDFQAFHDSSSLKYWIYRFQEASGFSSF